MVVGAMSAGMWVDGAKRGGVQYRMYDAVVDAFGIGCDEAPSDGFEENARTGAVGFILKHPYQ